MSELDITLLDHRKDLVDAWASSFAGTQVKTKIGGYFSLHADAIVSPANSFGVMDGGVDLALRNFFFFFFGSPIQDMVQAEIVQHWHGELPVGAALIVPTRDPSRPFLVVAPTMRVPGIIRDTHNAYMAFRAVLLACLKHKQIESILCCGMGTGVGQMDVKVCARQMRGAFDQVRGAGRLPNNKDIKRKHREMCA